VSGGSGSFSYTMSPGNIQDSDASTPNILEFEDLTAGDYTLIIDDDNCPDNITLSYSLTSPDELITSYELTSPPAQCNGDMVDVVVSATGGVPPYDGTGDYTLSSGEQNEIVITDANGCSSTEIINLPEPTELSANASIIEPIDCFGETATVEITANGGTPPYSGTGEFSVSSGNYAFTITDSNGCTYSNDIFISEPEELSYEIEDVSNPNCSPDRGYSNGSICISISGGTNPFPIGNNWTEVEEGIWCLDGLTSGNYLIDVTDDNNCLPPIEPTEVSLTRPEPIDAFISSDISANCNANTITQTNYVFVSGGTPPYEISWSGGSECETINPQCMETNEPGVYTAFIHDQESLENDCPPVEVDVTVDIPEIGDVSFDYSSPNSNFCDVVALDETINFNSVVTGDVVSVSWNFGDGSQVLEDVMNPTHTYDSTGTYNVELTVVYPFGCTKVFSDIVEVTKGYEIILPNAFTPNGDGYNDTIRPATLCFEEVKMFVYDTLGSLIYVETGDGGTLTGWNGKIDGKPAENGNYIIVVEAVTFTGKEININGPITLIK
jgi:gliding motility-associated-like protein